MSFNLEAGFDPTVLRLIDHEILQGAAAATSVRGSTVPPDEIWHAYFAQFGHDDPVARRLQCEVVRVSSGATQRIRDDGNAQPANVFLTQRDIWVPPGFALQTEVDAIAAAQSVYLRYVFQRMKLPRQPQEFTMPFMLPRGF